MNSTKFPKAFFLDLDGTILDTESLYLQLMLDYNKTLNLHISKHFYIINFLGKSKNDINKIMQKKWKKKYDEKSYWEGLLKYRNSYLLKNTVNEKKGIREFLNFLRLNKCYIGIVTSNSKDLVSQLFECSSLNETDFDDIVYRDDVQRLKPYADLYELAVERSGFEKNDIIAIEDSSIGIKAALNANLKIINIKDIDFINKKLINKCCMKVNSFYDIIDFYKNEGGNNGKE